MVKDLVVHEMNIFYENSLARASSRDVVKNAKRSVLQRNDKSTER